MECYVKNDKNRIRKKSDPNKYMFFEQGVTDGVSYINKRYRKANNEYYYY